jgi:hypothetical protein
MKNFLVNFHKGLRQHGSPRFFEDGECSIVQDAYLDEIGNVFSRKGIKVVDSYDYALKTIFPYQDDLMVAVSNGDLYKNTDLVGNVGSIRLSCVEYDNVLHLVNGVSRKRYSNQLQDIGNVAPFSAPNPVLENLTISKCKDNWTASANVATSVDEHDFKINPDLDTDITSIKSTIADTFATGLISYRNIISKDLSSYTHIGFWIKSNTNVNAGVLQLLLDNTAACVSPVSTIDIPALNINLWQWVVVQIPKPSVLTAVVSVGLNANSDPGSIIVKIDHIIAMKDGNLDGAYYYKYTYVDENGKESSASSASIVVNPKEEPVKIGVTASGVSKVSYINLYRLGGTLPDWYYITQVANTTQTITDDATDDSLVTLFDAEDQNEPDSLSFIVEHYERLIGAKPLNSIQYSKEYQPEYWSTNRQYLISNKDVCTGLLSWGRYIIFCKKDKIFVLEGSDPGSWHERKSDSTYGNIAPWALTFYKVPVFLSYFGLYLFNGNNESVLSERVKDFFNRNDLEFAISAIYDDRLYLALSDVVLVYDFILKIFYTYDLSLTEIRTVDNILYAGYNNQLVKLENTGGTVNFKIKSKAYPLNDIPNEIGQLQNVIINIDTKNEDVTLNVYLDEVLAQTKTLNTSKMTRLREGLNVPRGRYVEFEFTATSEIEIEAPLVVNPIG